MWTFDDICNEGVDQGSATYDTTSRAKELPEFPV